MIKLTTFLAFSLFLFAPFLSFNQEPTLFYAAEYYSDEIDIIDTTGLSFTIISSITATSDYGDVSGMYGLALHPITNEMYICYQTGAGAGSRRLGIIDLETAAITDIGSCGNIIDMAFGPDGTLYGATGNFSPNYSFVMIDIATASQLWIFDYTVSSHSGGMTYNPFTEEIYYQNNTGTSFIDPITFIETVGSPVGSPGQTQAMEILTPTLGWIAHYGTLYSFNPVTEVFTNTGTSIDSYHAFAFGPEPCTPLTLEAVDPLVCDGITITLDAVSPSGAIITWDGGVTDEVPFLPGPPGSYTYTATSDGDNECQISTTIEVVSLPTVTVESGDVNYCEDEPIELSASGDADEYTWEPEDFSPGIGVHTYTLTGTSFDTGCEATDEIIITVHALPDIMATVDDDIICIGNDVVFTGEGGETYVWSGGIVDGEAYLPETPGDYIFTVNGTDENGCINSDSIEIEVIENITLTGITTDEILGTDGEIDITILGGAPEYNIDWDDDGTGDFDDAVDRTGLAGGTYTVVVQGSEGCEATETFTINSQLSIETNVQTAFEVYPNPAIDFLLIKNNNVFNYELIGVNGKIIMDGTADQTEQISLKGLENGVYFLRLQTANNTVVYQVIKQ